VIGVLNSLVSVYYYLGVLVAMYMTEGERAIVAPAARPCSRGEHPGCRRGHARRRPPPAGPMEFARLSFASLK